MKRKKTTRVKRNVPRRGRKKSRTLRLEVRTGRTIWLDFLGKSKKLAWLSLWVALLFALVFAGRYGWQKVFIENEEFQLQAKQDVELNTNGHMNEKRLWAAAGLKLGQSIFDVSLKKIKHRLEALPEVQEAQATRRLPRTLKIDVTERVAVAWLECRRAGIIGKDWNSGLLLDVQGVCFPCSLHVRKELENLPIVAIPHKGADIKVGEKITVPEALRALHLLEQSQRYFTNKAQAIRRVEVINSYSLRAVTHEGVALTFGMYEHERQLQNMLLIQDYAQKTNRQLETANLLVKRNIPVTFHGDNWIEPVKQKAPPVPKTREEKDLQMILRRS